MHSYEYVFQTVPNSLLFFRVFQIVCYSCESILVLSYRSFLTDTLNMNIKSYFIININSQQIFGLKAFYCEVFYLNTPHIHRTLRGFGQNTHTGVLLFVKLQAEDVMLCPIW